MKSHPFLRLADSPLHQRYTVQAIQAPEGAPEWASQLHDLGFVPGERVQLMARGLGGDPWWCAWACRLMLCAEPRRIACKCCRLDRNA